MLPAMGGVTSASGLPMYGGATSASGGIFNGKRGRAGYRRNSGHPDFFYMGAAVTGGRTVGVPADI